MKKLLVLTAALCCLALPARADLIRATPFFVDLGAEGFGDAHRLLTLQNTPQETGTVSSGPGGTTIITNNLGVDPGVDKTAVHSAFDIGWLTGQSVVLGLNIDATGASLGLDLNTLGFSTFNNAGTLLHTYGIAAVDHLSAAEVDEQRGNGNGVFEFVLTTAQQSQFAADIIAAGGTAGLFIGGFGDWGCTPLDNACSANDGPDSLLAFAAPSAVPLPGTLGLFGGGLALLGYLMRRRKEHQSVSVLGAA